MRYLKILILFTIPALGYSQTLTIEQWREDLSYLQDLINHKYSSLLYKTSKEHLNEKIEDLYTEIPLLQRHEIIVGFAEIVAELGIGHSGISLTQPKHGGELHTGFSQIPINIYWFSDGVFVQAALQEYADIAGGKIIRIGSHTTNEALNKIGAVVSIENQQFFKAYGIQMMLCPEILHALSITSEISKIPLVVEKNGKLIEVSIEGIKNFSIPSKYGFVINQEGWVGMRDSIKAPLWMRDLEKYYDFKYLENEKTLYVRHSRMRNSNVISVKEFYDKVFTIAEEYPTEKFVLDLRLNGGGSSDLNKSIILGLIKSKLNIEGKLFVIVGRNTFSAAQNLVTNLEYFTNAIFVGEPTSSAINFFGDVNVEVLPNSKIDVRLSFLWHQEGHPLDKRVEFKPDVEVVMSSDDYAANRDVVLNSILNFENSDLSRMMAIKDHFRKGSIMQAKAAIEQVKAESNTLNLRSKLNSMGYSFMKNEELDAAKSVFIINTEFYPNEPNTWDSLAEYFMNVKAYDKAIEYYDKAIQLNPNGSTAANARKMLKKINNHLMGDFSSNH